MFEIDCEGKGAKPIRLASFPMEKFFNLYENPFTENVDFHTIDTIMIKDDGSLMSYYLDNGVLKLKSKGSIFSEHCAAAMSFLNLPENYQLKWQIELLTKNGITVNMEFTSPDFPFRIVIGYEKINLTILNLRRLEDGGYLFKKDISIDFDKIHEHWVDCLSDIIDVEAFINSIKDAEGIEGYVVKTKNDQFIRIKTDWYLQRHRAKDGINSEKGLFEAAINDVLDDIRSLFHSDQVLFTRIDDMERRAAHIFNHIVDTTERFYIRNKHLERKDYAILGQKELNKMMFGPAMSLYLGKSVDYKTLILKNYKQFGIGDITLENE